MFDIRDDYVGKLNIVRDAAMHGRVHGDVLVTRGTTFDLYGVVEGDLTVEAGARARVHGEVEGHVINLGGKVDVLGIIGGTGGTHDIKLHASAVIR